MISSACLSSQEPVLVLFGMAWPCKGIQWKTQLDQVVTMVQKHMNTLWQGPKWAPWGILEEKQKGHSAVGSGHLLTAAYTKKECNVNTGNLLTALENLGYWEAANKPTSAKIIYLGYLLKGGQHWLPEVYKETDQKACLNFQEGSRKFFELAGSDTAGFPALLSWLSHSLR